MQSRVAAAVGARAYDVEPSHCSGVYAYYADTGLDRNEVGFGDAVAALSFATNDGLACIAAAVHERALAVEVASLV